MNSNQTLTIIKPTAVRNNHVGAILKMINEAGFRIRAMKFTQLSREQAMAFYATHKGKSFFERLIDFMTSGPIVAAILEKDNAVVAYRTLIGATNPENAEEGTIRKLYATSLTQNAVHGSDCDESAITESDFFFSKTERFGA